MVSFSVIIVTHGREDLLLKCLDSLNPNVDHWQLILFANGRPLSEQVTQKAKTLTCDLSILGSDTQLNAGKARNLALDELKGEWVFFLDDDAYVLPGYWEVVLSVLQDQNVEVLGGPDTMAQGMGMIGQSISLALSSPFCTGTTFARHRPYGKKIRPAGEEILTSCNLWVRASALESVRFPEDFRRAEETVFLLNLAKQKKRMFYHPKLSVAHFRRDKLLHLFRPTFYAGFYRARISRIKVETSGMVFWLPSLFVLLHTVYFLDPILFWYLARLYLSLVLFMGLALSTRANKPMLFLPVAFFHYFIVFIYGIGFLTEKIFGNRR